jgi:DNA-binding GntR family transcriptional regulator
MTIHDDSRPAASAYEQAYAFLRQRIRDGRLPGGARVKAEEAAAELGVSRMPVREAIRRLDSEGLLTIRPNRGAVVTALGPEEIVELFEMRAALEGVAIRRAVPRFDEDALVELELLLAGLERARRDVDRWIARHNEFHDLICARSGGRRLAAEVQRLRAAVEPYLRIGLDRAGADGGAAEHRALLEAIRGGDPDVAERVMREHVLSTAHELVAAAPG